MQTQILNWTHTVRERETREIFGEAFLSLSLSLVTDSLFSHLNVNSTQPNKALEMALTLPSGCLSAIYLAHPCIITCHLLSSLFGSFESPPSQKTLFPLSSSFSLSLAQASHTHTMWSCCIYSISGSHSSLFTRLAHMCVSHPTQVNRLSLSLPHRVREFRIHLWIGLEVRGSERGDWRLGI